jgi:hypothetical protein
MLFTSQITAGGPFWTLALNCTDAPATTLALAGETFMLAIGSGLMVTEADWNFVASACNTAATVTVSPAETLAGAA